ncbi:hypothetical protein [Reyranella sp.]|uniref:hypothetical protein n=1 Tax=Reyranella sp. TaxID=1929291 RepID=UPI003D0AF139
MNRGEALLRRVSLLLGTGYILYFFSEAMFWSQLRPDEGLVDRPLACLFYSYLGYLTLVVLWYFRIRNTSGLFLAGAAFGWIGEGVFAMTLFGDPSMAFPFTISWTALAWHAPISVVLGWHALGVALRKPSLGTAAWLSLGFGVFWGVWAYGWRFETPPVAAAPVDFLIQATIATAFLALAYLGVAAGRPDSFQPSRLGLILAGLVLFGFLGAVTVPQVPLALLVLPALTALLFVLLRRHRLANAGSSPGLLTSHSSPPRPGNLTMLALMPLAATAVYALLGASQLPLHSLWAIGMLATAAGATLFLVAAIRTLRRSSLP